MQLSDSSPSVRSQIFTEQVAHLYKNAPLSYAFTVLNGFLLAFLQHSLISNQILLSWFSILILVTLARAILVYSYHRTQSRRPSIAYWHWAYIAGTTLAGCVWGSAAMFLFPGTELEHQLFVVFVLAGMTTASVSVLAASLVAFYLFAIPTLLPLAIQIFLHGSSLSTPMAMMILFFLFGLSIAARGMNQTILTSLKLRFNNRELVKEVIERQAAEEALYQQKERLQITFSAMAEGVIITSPEGSIEYLNSAAENMSGWVNSQVRDKNVEQVFNLVDETTGESRQSAIYECLTNAARSKKNSLLLTRDGEPRIIEEIATPLKARTGNIIGAVAILRDVTQASKHSRQLAYQASHDGLTGLPNRTLLCDRLEHAIAKAIRTNCLVAVLFMDLVRFKQINDRFGHAAGDRLLRIVAERLRASVRQEDTVARFGGDEFVVVLEEIMHEDQAAGVAQKIVKNLAVPLSIDAQEISIRVSIGITLFPRDGKNVKILLKNADTAMYRTKELAQDNIQFYTH
jgi:diguanylate cyclase (GGDEF)-like protein/PAS domain S-box-containing protein